MSADKRAALYVMRRAGTDLVRQHDLTDCGKHASRAGCRVVAMACDEDDPTFGAPKLCELMERMGEGEFEIIFGKAGGRHVVIELEGAATAGVALR